MMHTTDEME
jgi:hypothetical protein